MEHFIITTLHSIYNIDIDSLKKYLTLVMNYKTDEIYTELHHILPKSLFPQYKNDKWNLVRLSAKDHFYAHYYLHKALPNEPKMTFALWGMCNQKSPCHQERDYINQHTEEMSKIYEEAKIAHSELFRQRQLINNTMKGRTKENSPYYGIPRPKDVVDKMIENHWARWRKPWQHNMAKDFVWKNAEHIYHKWNEFDKCGRRALETKINYPRDSLNTIHLHFTKGWIPSYDDSYMEWIKSNP